MKLKTADKRQGLRDKRQSLSEKGQGLSEVVLISGLVAILSISALSLMGASLSKKLNTMWSFFGASSSPSSTALPTSKASTPATSTSTLNMKQSLTLEQQSADANVSALYTALQSGTANLSEVSGTYGNLANTNFALAEQLQALAESTVASNPQQSASLNELAKQVKILAAWQASTVLETQWWDGKQGDENGLINLMSTAMTETNTPIGSFDAKGIWIHGAAGAWEPAKSAEAAQQQAQKVATQWEALQQQSALSVLSTPKQTAISNAANTVASTSATYTAQNAQATYNNGQTIQTAGAAP